MDSSGGADPSTNPSLAALTTDGEVACPLCAATHDAETLEQQLTAHGISPAEFEQLQTHAGENNLGLTLTVGLTVTNAVTSMGEPTVELTQQFDELEVFLEKIESQTAELADQADQWRTERDELAELQREIHDAKQEQLPEAVESRLDNLDEKVEGQLESVDEKLSQLAFSSNHGGTQQELMLVREARNLNLGDDVIPRGGRSEEDIQINVSHEGQTAGTIVIESKNVKEHQSKHLEQLKQYCETRNADIGVLVTTSMPSATRTDDIDYWNFGDGMLVAHPDVFESVYLLARYAILEMHKTEAEYQRKEAALESSQTDTEKSLEELLAQLDDSTIVSTLQETVELIEKQNEDLKQIREYNNRRLKKVRRRNQDQVLDLLNAAITDARDVQAVAEDGSQDSQDS